MRGFILMSALALAAPAHAWVLAVPGDDMIQKATVVVDATVRPAAEGPGFDLKVHGAWFGKAPAAVRGVRNACMPNVDAHLQPGHRYLLVMSGEALQMGALAWPVRDAASGPEVDLRAWTFGSFQPHAWTPLPLVIEQLEQIRHAPG